MSGWSISVVGSSPQLVVLFQEHPNSHSITLCKLELVPVIHSIGVNISLQEHNGISMQNVLGPYENRSGCICNVSQHVNFLLCRVKVTFLCE